jgi:nondiscriminating glutamyl-tRNA synthetase
MRWDQEALDTLNQPDTLRTLEAVLSMLRRVEDWDGDTALTALRQAGKEVGAKGRSLFMPVRAAITGAVQGPELADVLAVQGRTTALRVLEEACALLRSSRDTQ